MPAATPQRQPEPPTSGRHPKPHIYTLETTGLLIIAALILILTLESGCGGAGTARIKEIEIGTVLPLTGSESTVV